MFDGFIAFQARQAPHAVAVSTLRDDVTFAQLDAAIGRVAAALADLPRPALAAVRVADPYLHWLLVLGLARLGIASASVLAAQDAVLLPLLRADLVLTDTPPAADGAGQAASWLHVSPDWVETTLRRADSLPHGPHRPAPDALGRVATSSGTTGLPRKLGLSWRGIRDRVVHIGFQFEGRATRLLSLLDTGGAFLIALTAWGRGGAVLFGPPQPAALAAALTRLKPTGLVLAPIQLRALLDALPPGFLPLPDLRVYASGSHTPIAVRRDTRLRLSQDMVLGYGTTEAGLIAQAPAAQLGDDEAAAGWPVPWVELEVVDEADRPVPPGMPGRIRVRGPEVTDGYLDDPAATAERFRDGWFYPGDVGSMAADGMLHVEGRTDEVMNFGGEKILPRVMEAAALGCPGVRDAGAFSLPDAAGLPAPWLALVRESGLDEAVLDRVLRDRLPALPPIRVAWIEAIPRNAGGKVERDRLRRAAVALVGGQSQNVISR